MKNNSKTLKKKLLEDSDVSSLDEIICINRVPVPLEEFLQDSELLAKLSSLRQLNLSGARFEHCEKANNLLVNLNVCRSLRILQLSKCGLTSARFLGALPQLQVADCSRNRIFDLGDLKYPASAGHRACALQSLDLSFNTLPVISSLAIDVLKCVFPGLNSLNVTGCPLASEEKAMEKIGEQLATLQIVSGVEVRPAKSDFFSFAPDANAGSECSKISNDAMSVKTHSTVKSEEATLPASLRSSNTLSASDTSPTAPSNNAAPPRRSMSMKIQSADAEKTIHRPKSSDYGAADALELPLVIQPLHMARSVTVAMYPDIPQAPLPLISSANAELSPTSAGPGPQTSFSRKVAREPSNWRRSDLPKSVGAESYFQPGTSPSTPGESETQTHDRSNGRSPANGEPPVVRGIALPPTVPTPVSVQKPRRVTREITEPADGPISLATQAERLPKFGYEITTDREDDSGSLQSAKAGPSSSEFTLALSDNPLERLHTRQSSPPTPSSNTAEPGGPVKQALPLKFLARVPNGCESSEAVAGSCAPNGSGKNVMNSETDKATSPSAENPSELSAKSASISMYHARASAARDMLGSWRRSAYEGLETPTSAPSYTTRIKQGSPTSCSTRASDRSFEATPAGSLHSLEVAEAYDEMAKGRLRIHRYRDDREPLSPSAKSANPDSGQAMPVSLIGVKLIASRPVPLSEARATKVLQSTEQSAEARYIPEMNRDFRNASDTPKLASLSRPKGYDGTLRRQRSDADNLYQSFATAPAARLTNSRGSTSIWKNTGIPRPGQLREVSNSNSMSLNERNWSKRRITNRGSLRRLNAVTRNDEKFDKLIGMGVGGSVLSSGVQRENHEPHWLYRENSYGFSTRQTSTSQRTASVRAQLKNKDLMYQSETGIDGLGEDIAGVEGAFWNECCSGLEWLLESRAELEREKEKVNGRHIAEGSNLIELMSKFQKMSTAFKACMRRTKLDIMLKYSDLLMERSELLLKAAISYHSQTPRSEDRSAAREEWTPNFQAKGFGGNYHPQECQTILEEELDSNESLEDRPGQQQNGQQQNGQQPIGHRTIGHPLIGQGGDSVYDRDENKKKTGAVRMGMNGAKSVQLEISNHPDLPMRDVMILSNRVAFILALGSATFGDFSNLDGPSAIVGRRIQEALLEIGYMNTLDQHELLLKELATVEQQILNILHTQSSQHPSSERYSSVNTGVLLSVGQLFNLSSRLFASHELAVKRLLHSELSFSEASSNENDLKVSIEEIVSKIEETSQRMTMFLETRPNFCPSPIFPSPNFQPPIFQY